MHVLFLTSPITFMTSDSFAFSLLLSMIAKSVSPIYFASALALTTPPTSGETTIWLGYLDLFI